MRILKSKGWAIVLTLLMLVTLVWVIVQNSRYADRMDNNLSMTVMLEGEYSIDGGAWQTIDNTRPIGEHFHRAVFKGHFVEDMTYYNDLLISSKNVWYDISNSKGEVFISNRRNDDEEEHRWAMNVLKDTPGYAVVDYILAGDDIFRSREDVTLTVEYPYTLAAESFSDCFQTTLSFSEGLYLRFFFEVLPTELVFLLVVFFGMFFFPVASGLLGRINFRYLTFGVLCLFAGLYMIMQQASGYLNLWIGDVTVCMMTDNLLEYLFLTAILLYFSSLVTHRARKRVAAVTTWVFFAMTIFVLVLHITGIMDMIASSPLMGIVTDGCLAVLSVLLGLEVKGKERWALIEHLVSWLPLAVFLLLDGADLFMNIGGQSYVAIGLAVTILYQLIRFGIDFRRQYLEAIRYQQMQKELYEAKVGIMVSQIQPHFMYNALTSIAMMCTIDPETAQEATITFAKYLRGNMDSLKQTKPIPFEQELEHLKKYLYIEKLRFGKKLNIVYDIQVADFVLPQLSIQPLVENAVKHGVGMKKKGGTVTIATRETDTDYEVVISDDGVGFDMTAEKKDDGRSHVGMENTRNRLRELCGGTIKVESTIGEGTTATVFLPKKGQHHENIVSG